MSAFSLIDVQTALFKLLSTDHVLIELGFAVYDYVPDQAEVRYVILGTNKGKAFDTKTELGMALEIELDTWSRSRGKKDVALVMTRIYDLLHEKDFDVPGQQVVIGRQDYATITKDLDGITYHGIQRFMFTTTPSTTE